MNDKILSPIDCKFCGRRPVLTERNGGWTVDCKNISPLISPHTFCKGGYERMGELFDTPNEAIINWNNENELSDKEISEMVKLLRYLAPVDRNTVIDLIGEVRLKDYLARRKNSRMETCEYCGTKNKKEDLLNCQECGASLCTI